jgi:hypothetical protein
MRGTKETRIEGRCGLGCKQLQLGELCMSVQECNAWRPRTSPGNLYVPVMSIRNFCWREALDLERRVDGAQVGT